MTTTASDHSELSGDDFVRVVVEQARHDKSTDYLARLTGTDTEGA